MISESRAIFLGVAVLVILLGSLVDSAHAARDESAPLLKLAQQEFGPLDDAEKKLFRCVANGVPCDFQQGRARDDDPKMPDNLGDECALHAGCLFWLCTDPEAAEHVTHRGVSIIGARIDGMLDLSEAQLKFPLNIVQSDVTSGIDLQSATLASLDLYGSKTSTLSAAGLKVTGGISLSGGFTASRGVNLIGATIDGQLNLDGAQLTENADGFALIAEAANIGASFSSEMASKLTARFAFGMQRLVEKSNARMQRSSWIVSNSFRRFA